MRAPCRAAALLRYTCRVLGTPVPAALDCLGAGGPGQRLLDAIYSRVLRPQHPSTADALSPLARKSLYIRAHWLRMPPHLLAYHLAHKALFPPEALTKPLSDDKSHEKPDAKKAA